LPSTSTIAASAAPSTDIRSPTGVVSRQDLLTILAKGGTKQ
jgi:hypothetical protein